MSVEILLWLLGASLVPVVCLVAKVYFMIGNTLQKTTDLCELAEKTEANTDRLADVLEDLAQLMRWLMERDGMETPPRVRELHK